MLIGSADRIEVQVSINGDQIQGLLSAAITTTNCFSADTYSLTFAMGARESGDISFWSTVSSAYVEVTVAISSLYGSTYQRLITGMADTIHVDPILGTVGVEGRDLSSSMVDSYRQQDFVNQTASEIVSAIAQYHGLQAVVTATSGDIGRYYSDGYTKLSLGPFSRLQSDWDVVVELARRNDFDVFVEGQTLYFQPSAGPANVPVPISLQDTQSFRIQRNLGIAANTAARVQSWSSQNMAAYDSDNPDGSTSTDQASSSTVNLPFLFSGSNYTAQQVAASAQRYAAELGRLGSVLHLEMPWDLSLSPRTTILLDDTNSLFDTTYLIDNVDRFYNPTSGSRQSIRAVQTSQLSSAFGLIAV
jgi:phage protein D